MKTILVAVLFFVIFLFVFRIFKTYFVVRKVYKDVINEQQRHQNNTSSTRTSSEFDKPKYNIEAETVEYEIIEEKDEK
ncbi:hypothetical protein ACF3NR_04370 [Vaginella massiliensis]|uniref:hypothetical protein n=1 Tax=Vaginella massiliensis TaxID=1816680 RepID=UPI000837DA50|nr:hypothetical protein [Vaginella massiliensis]